MSNEVFTTWEEILSFTENPESLTEEDWKKVRNSVKGLSMVERQKMMTHDATIDSDDLEKAKEEQIERMKTLSDPETMKKLIKEQKERMFL